jgi:hypothetical protein
MKSLLLATAVAALTTAAALSSASAEGPRASGGNSIPPTAENAATPAQYGYAGHQPPTSAEGPKVSGSNFIPPIAGAATPPAPHYEWQYGYVGRHAHYQGHWVLVR